MGLENVGSCAKTVGLSRGEAGSYAGYAAGVFCDERRWIEEERRQQPNAVAHQRVATDIAGPRAVWTEEPRSCQLQRCIYSLCLYLMLSFLFGATAAAI